jgi:hypothetical protein
MSEALLQHVQRKSRLDAKSFTPIRGPMLQRKCACGGTPGPTGECEGCRRKKLQRHSNNLTAGSAINQSLSTAWPVPPIVHEVLRSSGQPLDVTTRSFMESRFGYDFSRVRVHTDAKAAESARAVSALAYTVGQDIVFGADQYPSRANAGQRLLAHELTHVVQQSRSDPEQARTTIFRAAINGTSKTSGPEKSGATSRLYNLIERLEAGLQQQTTGTPKPSAALANSERNNAMRQSAGFIGQLRTVADGNDEALKQSVLAAFGPRHITKAIAQAEQKSMAMEISQESRGLATMPEAISSPTDAAEREAVHVSEAVISGNNAPLVMVSAYPSTIHRDGGAAAALAGLTAFELGGGAEVEAVTGPPGWVVAGVVGLAIAGLAIYVATTSTTTTKKCPPCPTPPGPDVDRVPPSAPHFPCPSDHWHYYEYNQNPVTCQCFGPRRLFGGCCGLPGAPC